MRLRKPRHDVDRRRLLRQSLILGGAASLLPLAAGGCAHQRITREQIDTATESAFGYWREQAGVPEFVYTANHETLAAAEWDPIDRPPSRRHFHMLGNRAIQMQASNTGDIALFDESEGMRWLVYGDDQKGTGHSVITERDSYVWGSSFSLKPNTGVPQRIFGTTYFRVIAEHNGLHLERTVLCPEGDVAWVLVKVDLTLSKNIEERSVTHSERWQLRPRFLHTWEDESSRDKTAAAVEYAIKSGDAGLVATEDFSTAKLAIGNPAELVLQALGDKGEATKFSFESSGSDPHPLLEARTPVTLQPGEKHTLWFRFGRNEGEPPGDPHAFYLHNQKKLSVRLPRGSSTKFNAASREIPWHAAALSSGANRDAVLSGHTLNQGSVYAFQLGANAAARDSLQHALPLVYFEPDLALSVLRNTCAWADPDGNLPYALTGNKQPLTNLFQPSDQNLWAFWLAAEYGAATGDFAAFAKPVTYHPIYKTSPVSLKKHLVRQFRFFIDKVGRGERGHVRIMNADWNDMVLEDSAIDRTGMIEQGSSVLNSAMASWVLAVFAPLMEKLGEQKIANEARQQSAELKELVALSWNGQWFDRAYGPGNVTVGADRCWLEVQPWAMLCGAANDEQALALLNLINMRHRANSPLGARVIWPSDATNPLAGQGTKGGIWYSINSTLVWAAAKYSPDIAWDEWRRMSLHAHTEAFPSIWEGTLSGPDAWNSPESDRPGHTWTTSQFSMQSWPVSNMHSHSQPLLAYLRLLGVEPNEQGTLAMHAKQNSPVAEFHSQTFSANSNGGR